jgi:hypothetical protein
MAAGPLPAAIPICGFCNDRRVLRDTFLERNTAVADKLKALGGILGVLVILALIVFGLSWRFWMGVGVYGPTRTVETTVNRVYIDTSKEGSHYMVGTDSGVYEIENGYWLGVNNADELYAKLKDGRKYRLTTEGNKVVWYFGIQEYPFITKVEAISVE